MGSGRRIRGAALALVAIVACACGFTDMQNLAFRVDNRLHFVSPPARALVATPITVRWRMSGFTVERPGSAPPTRDAGYFAVFVDRAPIRPGDTMRSVAKGDEECLHQRGCPGPDYLRFRGIYTTTADQVTVTAIPPLAGDNEMIQLHSVTVVLMDTSGHRIGEYAWELDLRMKKPGL